VSLAIARGLREQADYDGMRRQAWKVGRGEMKFSISFYPAGVYVEYLDNGIEVLEGGGFMPSRKTKGTKAKSCLKNI